MSIINAYGDSTITVWEVDDNGEKISVPILNEKKQVIGNKIVLEGLPDEQYRVFIDGFIEIDIKDKITETNQFKVDYRKYGTVFFHPDLDGQWITINRYYSKGLIYIPSSRIWVKINEFGEVIETLDSVVAKIETISGVITDLDNVLINANTTKSDLDNSISIGNTTKSNLDTSINAANNINDTLSNPLTGTIKKATDINSTLSNITSTAETTNDTLSQTNNQAQTTKSNLDSSISTGNTLKTNLDNNISTGTTLNNDLNTSIDKGNQLKIDLPPLVDNANTSKTNLDTTVSNANIKKTELDGSISTAITNKTELDTSISTAGATKTNLDNSVSSANTINDTLSNTTTGTIKKATDINSTLGTTINSANTSKSDLDGSITQSTTSKTNLDSSITNANTTKTELDNSISTANTTKTELDTSTTNANTINDTLSNATTGTIKQATDINTTLNSSIDIANTSKTNLDTSINNSTTAKTNLDDSISTANVTKTALDGSITEGTTLKGDLDAIISGTDYEQIITDVDDLKQDQHNHTNKGTLDGLSDVNGKLKYNGQDVGIGDMTKAEFDVDGDGIVDKANDSNKLGGQLPSYYAQKTYVDTELSKKINTTEKGNVNGLAELDAGGKVPASQLPSYVDDVLEFASKSIFPTTGETGKIYVAIDTNLTYRWSGTEYIEISPSIALGETSSTAYRGDRGKVAYDHSQLVHDKHLVGLGNVDNTSDLDKPISTAMLEALNNKVNNARVLTDVPVNAKFTDTVTTINGKAGAISKEDIVALGIPSQDTNTIYSELSSTATNIDNEGIYQNIEWKRKDGTIYAKSALIGSYPYPQIKIDYYDEIGTTIVKTITWDLTYDDNDFPYVRMVI